MDKPSEEIRIVHSLIRDLNEKIRKLTMDVEGIFRMLKKEAVDEK